MITLIIIYSLSGVNAIINPHGPTVISDYANCVSKIIQHNFNHSGLFFFVNTNNMSSSVARIQATLLAKVHKDMKYAVQVGSPRATDTPKCSSETLTENLGLATRERYETYPLADYILIIIDSHVEFSYAVSRLIGARSWNPKAFIIVLFFNLAKSDAVNIEHAELMVQCLFKWNSVNVVVIVPETVNIRNAIVYSWKPYDPPEYCGYGTETAQGRLFVENRCANGEVVQQKNIFYNKVPTDMKGCEVNILALERHPYVSADPNNPNLEKKLLSEILQKEFNFKTNYVVLRQSNRGEKDDDEWNGALQKLIHKKGDMLFGGIFPDDEVHKDFECSTTYLSDSYTWVVPRAQELPPYLSLVIIFHYLVWLVSAACFVVVVIAWKILGKLSGDTPYHQSFGHCCMNALVSNLGFAAYARPVTEGLRVYFCFFSLYCILFLTVYQTKLIDVLTNPSFEYQIDSVQELVTSGLKWGGMEELHDLFYNSSDEFDRMVGDHWVNVRDNTIAILDVVLHRNFSLLCSRLTLSHMSSTIPELSDSMGNYRYYAFTESVFAVPVEVVAMKGFPFLDAISVDIQLMKQLGLTEYLRKHFKHLTQHKRAELMRSLTAGEPDESPLSLGHLQGGFYALFLGYISGTLALLIESFVSNDTVKNKFAEIRRRFKGKLL